MEHTGHPLSLNIPRDRATINAWLRSVELTDPIIHNTINFHVANIESAICISPPTNKKFEPSVKVLTKNLQYVIHELVLIGECFPLIKTVTIPKDDGFQTNCQDIIIQNPDYVNVKRGIIGQPVISLRPDENLRRLILSSNITPEEQEELFGIDNKTIVCVKNGENIPLDPEYIWHLKLLSSKHDLRGSSYLNPILSALAADKPLDSPEIKHTILYPFDNPGPIVIKMIQLFYDRVWDQLEPWIIHYFSTISKLNDWYEYNNGEKVLWHPPITFENPAYLLR